MTHESNPTKETQARIRLQARGHFFGHYDSRGGATLITGGIFEALKKYADSFGWEEMEKEAPELIEQHRELASDEHMGSYDVFFLDKKPEDESELQADYGGPFHMAAVFPNHLQESIMEMVRKESGDDYPEEKLGFFPDVFIPKAVVFWTDETPTFEGHFLVLLNLGEDAFGTFFYNA